MRIVVFSDSHRMESRVFEVIERHKDNADLFLFLGDGNDDVDTAIMVYRDINIDRVSGNCDFSSPYPSSKIIEFAGKRILFTHGHPYYVKHGYSMIMEEAERQSIDICLFGHTHIPYTEIVNKTYYMNPGSLRDGAYGIIDITDKGTLAYNTQL